jgi:hypothetical protein
LKDGPADPDGLFVADQPALSAERGKHLFDGDTRCPRDFER